MQDKQRLDKIVKERDQEIEHLKFLLNQQEQKEQINEIENQVKEEKLKEILKDNSQLECGIAEWKKKFQTLSFSFDKKANFSGLYKRILLLTLENDRLHGILKDGLEENEMLRKYIENDLNITELKNYEKKLSELQSEVQLEKNVLQEEKSNLEKEKKAFSEIQDQLKCQNQDQ